MTSHSEEETAALQERLVEVEQPVMKSILKRGQVSVSVVDSSLDSNAEGQAPICGASPNNAELVNDVDCPELGSLPQQPPHRSLGRTSLTKYLKSLGVVRGHHNEDSEAATASLKPGISECGEISISKGTRNTRATSISRPFDIHLDVDNYSYSRDAVENSNNKSGIPTKLNRRRTTSPDEYRRSAKRSLNRVPEEMEAPPADGGVEFPPSDTNRIQQNNVDGPRFYGSVGFGAPPNITITDPSSRYPQGVFLDDDDSDLSEEEEEEWLLDEELAKQGLYRGNYKTLVLIYTLVPISTILTFVFLALLPSFALPTSKPSKFPYPPYLPFPLPELLVTMALWALSYLLRDFLHATSVSGTTIIPSSFYRFPILTSILTAFLQSASSLFFRLIAIPILLIPHYSTEHVGMDGLHPIEGQSLLNLHKRHFPTWQDDAFRRVWWVALGWAAAEAVVGIKQGYESISLYKDVLVTARRKEVNYMETRRPRDEENQSVPATREASDHLRSVTPTQARLQSETETSLTPTQKDQRRPLPINPPPPPPRRDLSESISSISSVQSPNLGPVAFNSGLGEREPLLKLDIRPELSRRATDELSGLSAESEVERDLDQLLALKSREELEEVYGIPVIRIPVAISCLHRINSILSSLGIYLLITSAYMRSTFAYHNPPSPEHAQITSFLFGIHQDPPSNKTLAYTLPPLLLLQVLLSMMHTPWILPRIGIHTFVYVGLLASLGLFFGGLGMWEVLT